MLNRFALAGALALAVTAASADEYAGQFFIEHSVGLVPAANARAAEIDRPMRLSGADMLDGARRFLGSRNPTGFHGAWCGAFMAMIARREGRSIPPSPLLARSWARAGRPSGPVVGAIAVMPHHVGVVAAVKPGKVLLVSGNHGHRVGVGWYAARRVIAYREV